MKIRIMVAIEVDKADVEAALAERGMETSKANVNRFLRMMRKGTFRGTRDLFRAAPRDRIQLLMHGLVPKRKVIE